MLSLRERLAMPVVESPDMTARHDRFTAKYAAPVAKAPAPKSPVAKKTVVASVGPALDLLGMKGVWLPAVHITRAKPDSSNPGALYLKSALGEYLGKIRADGSLWTVHPLADEVKGQIREFVMRGREYLDEVGKATGWCAYCGRELTDPDSVVRGYGPVCAKNYGLDHPNRHGF